MDETKQEKAVNRKPALIVSICIILVCFAVHYTWLHVFKEQYASSHYFAYLKYFLETFIVQCGNFGIVATLLWWFGGPMLQNMVLERKKSIERDIDESGRQKEAAEKVYAEISEKMADLDDEKEQMAKNFAVATEAECARIQEDAQKTAARIEEDAKSSFELQANVAQRAFETEVMTRALEGARQEIARRVQSDPALRDKLIEQGIASLEI